MTLSTDVYIQGPVDLAQLKQIVQQTLAAFDEHDRTPEEQAWNEESETFPHSWSTVVGQGLPAWTYIHFGADGQWRQADDEEDDGYFTPKHFAVVDFDTAYSYRGPDGQTCSGLHVALMTQLGVWLDGLGVKWQWRDEYTGKVHDAYDGFETFGKW